jgi:hypothetical protein
MFARKSDPPVPRKRKKLVFTIEYLESKLNRKLDDEEAGRLKEYIQKGQNTKIFEMLVGGGKDQVWKCQYCTEEIRGSPKDVKEHYATLHDAVPIFPCQLCDKVLIFNFLRFHTFFFCFVLSKTAKKKLFYPGLPISKLLSNP